MRKIVSRSVRERKETRNKVIMSVLLVGLMLLSTAGYAFYRTDKGTEKKADYGGIKFILKDDNLWHFKIENYEFSASFNPGQTENLSNSVFSNLQEYAGKALYFSYDSSPLGIQEIRRNIERFVSRTQLACLKEKECENEDLPVKSCTENNIIIIKENNETLIRQEDKCIYILTKQEDILRAGDAFIFRILGVQ